MANNNFGTMFTIAGCSGNVLSVSAPKMSVGKLETTHMQTAGWRTYISDGLRGVDSFEVTMQTSAALVQDIFDVFSAGESVACVFTGNDLPAWSFDGILLTFDLGKADAKSPDIEQVIITVQPTDDITIAAEGGDWFDGVSSLFTDLGGAYTMAAAGEHQLAVYAIRDGSIHTVSVAEMSDLTFASTVGAKATVSATGLVEGVASGNTTVTVAVTSAPTINTSILFTVTA